MPHRCAFGCKATDVVMHMFPNPNKFSERFKTWVSLVGRDLQMLSANEIYQKKRICDIHFTDNHRNRFKRLSALAVPSLNLPNTSWARQAESSSADQPSVPAAVTAAVDISRVHQSSPAIDVHSADTVPVATDLGQNYNAQLLAEHNYSAASKLGRTRSAKDTAGKPYYSIFTQPLRKKVRYLQNEISRLRKKSTSFKNRLASAASLSTNVEFQRLIQSMSKPAQLLMHMQEQTRKNPKGRRFSIEEKTLSYYRNRK